MLLLTACAATGSILHKRHKGVVLLGVVVVVLPGLHKERGLALSVVFA